MNPMDDIEPLELKPIEIRIKTNFYDDKTFILTNKYLEFNDPKKTKSKQMKMNELPYFTINYEIPENLIFETYTSNKRITLFFRKKKLQDIIMTYNKPITLGDSRYNEKIQKNVMTMVKCLFPTTYPVVDNHLNSFSNNICDSNISSDDFYSYVTQTISKFFNSNKMYMNIEGAIYTPYRVTFLNDIVNHPKYGEIIRDISDSKKLKNENERELHENILLLKERIYNSFIMIRKDTGSTNHTKKTSLSIKTFINGYLRQNLIREQQQFGTNYNYLEKLQQACKLVIIFGKLFVGDIDAEDYQTEITTLYNRLEQIYNTQQSNNNYNTVIIQILDSYLDQPLSKLKVFDYNNEEKERECVRKIIFRNNLSFIDFENNNRSKSKIIPKIIHKKTEDYRDCFPTISTTTTPDDLYEYVYNYIQKVIKKFNEFNDLLNDAFQNNIFKDIPRTTSGFFFNLSSLITDYKDYSVLENVKTVYFDKTTTLIEDESNRFNELVKRKYKEYDYTFEFNEKVKKLIKPYRESTNNQLKYILETYNSDDNVNDLFEKIQNIYSTYILNHVSNISLETQQNNMQIMDVGVSHYNAPTDKPKFEIYLLIDFFEGKLTAEVEKKISCIFQNEALGELYQYLVSADKNRYIVEKGRLFSIPKLLAYVDSGDKKSKDDGDENDRVKQGGRRSRRIDRKKYSKTLKESKR